MKKRGASTIPEITMELIADQLRKHEPDREKVSAHYRELGRYLRDKYGVKIETPEANRVL